MIKNNKHKTLNVCSGFTIVEGMVVIFIFALITVSFYSVFSLGVRLIADAKNRLGAMALANEKMEIVRNIAYGDIGTVGGAPDGVLLENEDVIENTRQYHVQTSVQYENDDFDGQYPDDTVPGDYKKVTITISWNGGTKEVRFVSTFVPPGLEVAVPGDGILSINVFSDQPGGAGIPDSSVHVANSDTGLNTTVSTDSNGNIILIGENIKDSIQKYQIHVSKSGYEEVYTMPPYPDTSYSPIDVHASVITGSLNVINIVQNKLTNLKISTSNYLGESIGNIGFDISGGRKLGYEVDAEGNVTSVPVYNPIPSTETGSDGEKDFGLVSPGQYTIVLPSSVTDSYEVIGKYPIDPFNLSSDTNLDFEIRLASKSMTSLMVKVLSDAVDNPSVSGAVVQLTNSLGYDVTQTAGADGVVFFPTTSDIFQAETYDIKITADGFQEKNSSVTVNSNELKVENIILTTSP